MRFFSLGSLNIDYVYAVDHFVSAGETLSSTNMEIFPGGKGLNQSIALARAGAKVLHGGLIGNDGAFLADILADDGVDVSRISTCDEATGHAIIQVNPQGQNCILLFPGANRALIESYVTDFLADAEENDVLLMQNETNCIDIAFKIAKKKKMQIAFNPSPFDKSIENLPLEYVDWFFCNEIEGKELFGSSNPERIADLFSERFPNAKLILTLGKHGAIYSDAKERYFQPAYVVEAVDTTAA
ncbi:MAG: ribokinase, partial [Clostridia bacterium]|nr:ribokinase [Clostridia bacterium]